MVPSIKLAIIKEEECVGCTKCIEACPVDAIIGASQLMHSVLSHECIGCGLCIEPCPMDCIEMVQIPNNDNSMRRHELAALARSKHIAKRNRKILEYLPALPNSKDANHRNKILNEIELAKGRVNARRNLLDQV